MAKVSAIQKNKRRQKLVASHAKKRASLKEVIMDRDCLLYTSPSPRDTNPSRMPSSA